MPTRTQYNRLGVYCASGVEGCGWYLHLSGKYTTLIICTRMVLLTIIAIVRVSQREITIRYGYQDVLLLPRMPLQPRECGVVSAECSTLWYGCLKPPQRQTVMGL